MTQLTEIKTIRFSKQQIETFETLKKYDIKIDAFIRIAIKEKIKKDWSKIKHEKEAEKLPF